MRTDNGGGRRETEILQGALRCFLAKGYDAASLEDIRLASGASIGSIYHHFAGKEAIAGALYVYCLRDYGRWVREACETPAPRSARGFVRQLVRAHLGYVQRFSDRAAYLAEWRSAATTRAVEDEIAAANRDLFGWFLAGLEAWTPALRRLPVELAYVILLGPAQEYARLWLRSGQRWDLSAAAEELASAAWRAVSVGHREPEKRSRA